MFLEEERERELEAIHDANVDRDRERDELRAMKDGDTGVEASAVTKTTTETLMAGERIIEALDISEEDRLSADGYEDSKAGMTEEAVNRMAPRQRHAIFSIYTSHIEPEVHVLKVVQKIAPSALNDALLVLPFAKVVSMLKHLDYWSKKVSCPAILWRLNECLISDSVPQHCSHFENSYDLAEHTFVTNHCYASHANYDT